MSSLLEAIKNKRQQIAAKSGRERPVKLGSAKNLIRVLPNWKGEEGGAFSQDFGQHFIKDKSGKIQAVYVCVATTFGRECDICSEIARISASTTDEANVKVLTEARSSSRVLINAVYMNGTHANAKTDPVLLELPVSVFNDILGIAETYLEDHGINIFDLAEGYDLIVSKSGSGLDTSYTVTPSPKSRAIPAETLDKARDLEAYAQQEHQAERQKALTALDAATGVTPLALTADKPAASPQARLAQQAPVDFDDADDVLLNVPDEKPAKTVAPAAPAASSLDDDLAELDALLAAEA